MKLFLDTEFTGLQQSAHLMSLALVAEDDRWFYAEFTDYDPASLSDWHRQNVVPYLHLDSEEATAYAKGKGETVVGNTEQITARLRVWLDQFEALEIWADVPAYDWVFFCELFGSALQLPKNIFYMPFDLATLLKVIGLDPDADRELLAREWAADHPGQRHNALYDASLTKAVFQDLKSKIGK